MHTSHDELKIRYQQLKNRIDKKNQIITKIVIVTKGDHMKYYLILRYGMNIVLHAIGEYYSIYGDYEKIDYKEVRKIIIAWNQYDSCF